MCRMQNNVINNIEKKKLGIRRRANNLNYIVFAFTHMHIVTWMESCLNDTHISLLVLTTIFSIILDVVSDKIFKMTITYKAGDIVKVEINAKMCNFARAFFWICGLQICHYISKYYIRVYV